jgi:hypothetical protein
LTPLANLLLATLLLVSTTPVVTPFTGIYIDCSEISGNFATCVNDAGGKFATIVLMTLVVIFLMVNKWQTPHIACTSNCTFSK